MTPIATPSSLLPPEWQEAIRSAAPAAERDGRLTPEVTDLIHSEGWFRLHVPTEYGGPEWDLPRTVRLLEGLAWADGSTGWTVTLCSGAGWFGGFLEPALSREVFSGSEVCLAGTGAAAGTAREIAGGFRVSGTWPHASGALHATHFTANCRMLDKEGQPRMEADGQPLIRPFLLLREEVAVIPSWRAFGMKATGSHSFSADVAVPPNRCFRIDPAAAVIDRALYRYPFLQLAEATLAVNLSGMALHFLELCHQLFVVKKRQPSFTDRPIMDDALAQGGAALDRVRTCFYTALQHSWHAFEKGSPEEAALPAVSTASRELAAVSRQVVDALYPYCGLSAADPETALNRVWRDLHTASQHPLLVW